MGRIVIAVVAVLFAVASVGMAATSHHVKVNHKAVAGKAKPLAVHHAKLAHAKAISHKHVAASRKAAPVAKAVHAKHVVARPMTHNHTLS